MNALSLKKALASASAFAMLGLLASLSGAFTGCSADGTIAVPAEHVADAAAPPPETDAGGPDAPACEDCAFYLRTCEAGSFCPVNLEDLGVERVVLVSDLSGTSESDVWAAGSKGTVLHYDGASWSTVKAEGGTHTQISARTASDVWIASTLSRVFVRPPSGADAWPRARLVPLLVDAHVNGMWSASDATWTWLAVRNEPYAYSTKSLNLKRARKSTTAYRFQEPFECGGNCSPFLTLALLDVHGTSKNELWAVGEAGTTYRISDADADRPILTAYDSRTFSTLHAVWTSGSNDVWAVGNGGTLRHYTGGDDHRLESVASPVTSTLRSVWGTSKTDVWAVGDGGVILHYDGESWTRVPLGGVDGKPDLYAVWAATPTRVWVAGRGVLLELEANERPVEEGQ